MLAAKAAAIPIAQARITSEARERRNALSVLQPISIGEPWPIFSEHHPHPYLNLPGVCRGSRLPATQQRRRPATECIVRELIICSVQDVERFDKNLRADALGNLD